MPENKHLKFILCLFYTMLGTAFIYIFIKKLLPGFLPLILSFFAAWAVEPAVEGLNKRLRLPRAAASALCTLLILSLFLIVVGTVAARFITELGDLAKMAPDFARGVAGFLAKAVIKAEDFMAGLPDELQHYLIGAYDQVVLTLSSAVASAGGGVVKALSSGAVNAPSALAFIITVSVSLYFISCSFPSVKSFLKKYVPLRVRRAAIQVKATVLDTAWKWISAQIKLLLISFLVLTASFLLLKIPWPFALSALLAILEAMPVIGSGTVLFPWAIFSFFSGNYGKAAALLIIWLTVNGIKGMLEPKLMGEKFGLHPAVSLATVYAGLKILGPAGMFAVPLFAAVIKTLFDQGVIRADKNAG